MATPVQAQDHADVPRTGGYTRFELELEVRPLFLRRRHEPLARFDASINTPLVCAVSRESRLSQFSGYSEDVREARVRSLSRLPAVLQGSQIRKVPTVSSPSA